MLAVSIARSNAPGRRSVVLVTGWVLVLTASLLAGGRVGLGTVLSTAFVVQVAPAVWTAYRTQAPTGIATGTWLLVLGELTCWGIYGLHQGDRRLAVMGVTGVLAAGLMILRATTAGRTHLATAASVPRVVERAAAGDARW
jgi:hypothetical protein